MTVNSDMLPRAHCLVSRSVHAGSMNLSATFKRVIVSARRHGGKFYGRKFESGPHLGGRCRRPISKPK